MPTLRLFIAFDTPPTVRPALAAMRDELKLSHAEVKWEPDAKFHCTIKFLGDTPEHLVPELIARTENASAATRPFSVRYRNVGCFPSLRDPRVVWIGIENLEGELLELSKQLESALIPLGFQTERKAFHPHVTLGRVKGRKNLNELLTMLETVTFESQPVTIPSIEIVKSELKTGGSEYSIVRSILFSN